MIKSKSRHHRIFSVGQVILMQLQSSVAWERIARLISVRREGNIWLVLSNSWHIVPVASGRLETIVKISHLSIEMSDLSLVPWNIMVEALMMLKKSLTHLQMFFQLFFTVSSTYAPQIDLKPTNSHYCIPIPYITEEVLKALKSWKTKTA